MNKHAYLRLPKILVKKEELGHLLDKYDRIETHRGINKQGDISKIRIIPYVYINSRDFQTIMGSCEKYNYLQNSYLTGCIGACKKTRRISHKDIKKLMELEKELGINLSISKDIKNKVKKYV